MLTLVAKGFFLFMIYVSVSDLIEAYQFNKKHVDENITGADIISDRIGSLVFAILFFVAFLII